MKNQETYDSGGRGGGSNGFDREANYLEYKNYKLEETTESFNFNRVLEILNDKWNEIRDIKIQLGQIPIWNY